MFFFLFLSFSTKKDLLLFIRLYKWLHPALRASAPLHLLCSECCRSFKSRTTFLKWIRLALHDFALAHLLRPPFYAFIERGYVFPFGLQQRLCPALCAFGDADFAMRFAPPLRTIGFVRSLHFFDILSLRTRRLLFCPTYLLFYSSSSLITLLFTVCSAKIS